MRSPKRGQILLLKRDAAGKKRPILVVSPVQLNGGLYLSGVPFYSQNVEKLRDYPNCVYFAAGEFGLDRNCVAKANEVSQYRISEFDNAHGPIGTVDDLRMEDISAALCYSLGIAMHREPE